MGLIGFLFFIILSVSGILLMHGESLHLKDKIIDGKYLPDKYFRVRQDHNAKVRTVYVSPRNSNEVLVGTNIGIFKTIDAGESWLETNIGLYNLDISVIRSDPFNYHVLYAGTQNGIFKSTNAGESWDEWFEESGGLEHTDITDLVINPADSKKLYVATQNEIFLSEDGGDSWNKIFEVTPLKADGYISSLYISPKNPSVIYAGTFYGLFKTLDGGKNWEKIQSKLLDRPILSVFASNRNPNHMLIGTDSGLIQSFNNGKIWSLSLENKSIRFIVNHPGRNNEFIVATADELFKSRDNGQVWKSILIKNNMNIVINSVNFTGLGKRKFFLGTDDGLLLVDEENNWKSINMNITKDSISDEPQEMSFLKLVTEIHTGRFFGSYFYLIFDLASVFLIMLSITGIYICFIRKRVWKRQKENVEKLDKLDLLMDFTEKAEEISKDSESIHDMAEHIRKHMLACKKLSKNGNKVELKKIEAHLESIDKMLHHLMNHIEDMSIK